MDVGGTSWPHMRNRGLEILLSSLGQCLGQSRSESTGLASHTYVPPVERRPRAELAGSHGRRPVGAQVGRAGPPRPYVTPQGPPWQPPAGLAVAGALASLVVLLRAQTGRSAAAFGASAVALYFTQ